jgi:hypothetical protein
MPYLMPERLSAEGQWGVLLLIKCLLLQERF